MNQNRLRGPFSLLGAVLVSTLLGCSSHGDAAASPQAQGEGGAPPGVAPPMSSGGTTANADALPCDVAAIVQSNCAVCHSPPLDFGVPMPLLTAADFRRPAISDASRTVASLAADRIANDAKPMPPPPRSRLSPADAATLTAWLRAGAQGTPSGCAVTPQHLPAGTAPTSAPATGTPSGSSMPAPTSAPTSTGTSPPAPTGALTTPPTSTADPPTNPGETPTCYDFTSHGGTTPGDSSAFMIPTGESYHCFYFDVPWNASAVATAFRSKLDNTKGLHHWFLYAMPTARRRRDARLTPSNEQTVSDPMPHRRWSVVRFVSLRIARGMTWCPWA